VKRAAFAFGVGVSLIAYGCSAATWQGVAAGLSAAGTGAQAPTTASTKHLLFGGENHKTYLGCINCSEYDSDSVFNTYGTHGSPYASDSVLNHYGQFGSKYSNYGACNAYANDPPIIVDGEGNFYGRLKA
jgi:hypothetical protein